MPTLECKSITETMIDLVDQTKLENTLKYLASESFNNSNFSLSWHLKKWAIAKQHIFVMLGNKLKVESPVDSVLSRNTILEMFRSFSQEYIEDNRKFDLVLFFLSRLDIEEIALNTLKESRTLFDTEFKSGMKVSRILAKLVNKEYAHDLQTQYSMFLQKLKAKGKAVISIDPIDYITMSVNKSGWRSCHALDGEYRTGTLAYMIDPSTTINYVKTSEDVTINEQCLPYSNKVWRQISLISVKDSFVIQGRQYPGDMPNNEETISKMFIDLLQNINPTVKYKTERARSGKMDMLIIDGDYANERLWYNDFSAEAFSSGNVVLPEDTDFDWLCSNASQLTLGASVKCVESSDHLEDPGCLSMINYHDNREDDYYDDDDYDNDDDNDNREW